MAGLLEQSLERRSRKLEADVRRVIEHPDHRVSDKSRLTTRSWGVPQPSHTSWFSGTPEQYLIVVLGHPTAMRPLVRTSSTLACGQSLLRFGTRERTVANVVTVAPFELPSAVE